MGDRRIDADHQIEAVDERRRVREVLQIGGKIVQRHATRRIGDLRRRSAFFCNEMKR